MVLVIILMNSIENLKKNSRKSYLFLLINLKEEITLEITNVNAQTVAVNQDVLFTNVAVCGNNSMIHRSGSGLVTLRGLTNCQCRARYRVFFAANIAVPTGGTAGAISLTLALDGEPISTTSMIATPAAVNQYNNVASAIFIDVPKGCCEQVSVRNTSTQPILV